MDRRFRLALIIVNLLFFGSIDAVVADSERAPDTRKSVILDPFNHQFGRLPYYEPFLRSIIHNLERTGFTVDYYKDDHVTIDLLKRLDDEEYEVIYINTHGFMDSEGQILIFTGEKHTPEKERLYREDIEEERIRGFESEGDLMGYYYVTPTFFTWYGNDTGYCNALIFIDACHSANNTSMAKAFLDLDAGCYVGWTADVGIEYGVAMDGQFFRQMCKGGETVEQSIRKIKPDPNSKSKMIYFGDGSLTVTDAPYEPESQGLPAWFSVTMLAMVLIAATGILWRFIKRKTYIEAHNN